MFDALRSQDRLCPPNRGEQGSYHFLNPLAQIFHEYLAATMDMDVLPSILGCRPLRRTVQVRLGINPAVLRDGCPVARPPRLSARDGGQARPSSRSRYSNS